MADSGKTKPGLVGASGTGSCGSVLSCHWGVQLPRWDQDTGAELKRACGSRADDRCPAAGPRAGGAVPQRTPGAGAVGACPLGCPRRLRWELAPNLLQGAAQLGLPGAAGMLQALPGAPTAGGDGPAPSGQADPVLTSTAPGPCGPRAGPTGRVRKGNSRAGTLLTSSWPRKKRLWFPP